MGTGFAPMGSIANCQATGLGPHFRVHCRISKGSKCWETPHKSGHPVSAKLGMASRLVRAGVCSWGVLRLQLDHGWPIGAVWGGRPHQSGHVAKWASGHFFLLKLAHGAIACA